MATISFLPTRHLGRLKTARSCQHILGCHPVAGTPQGRGGDGDGSGTGQTPPGVKKGFLKPLAAIVIPTVFVGFAAVAKNHLELAVFNAISVWIMGATNDALNLRRRVQIPDVWTEPSFEPAILVYGNPSLADVFGAGANTEHR
jgi:hypothetical protein